MAARQGFLERVRRVAFRIAEAKIKSAASRRHWADTPSLLVPAFGMLYVDELRYADLVTWRDQVGRWLRDGMPSRRKRDAGKNKIVNLSPVTANGWISILKTNAGEKSSRGPSTNGVHVGVSAI